MGKGLSQGITDKSFTGSAPNYYIYRDQINFRQDGYIVGQVVQFQMKLVAHISVTFIADLLTNLRLISMVRATSTL